MIMRLMKVNYNNPQQFLEDIECNRFRKDKKVIGVFPKGKEMQNHTRLFALLPLRKHRYVSLMEALLIDFILPYFPDITMTFDASILMNRIHRNTQSK